MSRAQLSQLLPLPDDELQQVLDYAATLSKPDAASHFSNLLGDSPLAVDFIASFNARRETPSATHSAATAAASSSSAVPKSKRGGAKKKKAALHTPQARLADSYIGPSATAYSKKDTDLEYISQRTSAPTSNHASRPATPPLTAAAAAPKQHQQPAPKQHASSAGFLISESLSKPKSKSNPSTRSSTPKPAGATKITLAGGTPMAGQASATADLDAAIRALELSTNPSLDSVASRRCPCVATRHPLQTAAPNCLSCGKVICVREGLGPCTFCGAPLLAATEVQALVRALKDERGRERMAAHASTHRRAEISQNPAPFSQPRGNFGTAAVEAGPSIAEASAAQQAARQHRDKLLNFQAQNAQRTTVRDEASDFDVTAARAGTGGNMWASPEERARELKRQQKILREMEWNARPEYEKRQQVMSIDLVNGRVVRKMAPVERPRTPEEDSDTQETILSQNAALTRNRDGGGAFSSNPLLGALMKPVFTPSKGKETATAATAGAADDEDGKEAARRRRERRKGWRRVQDDQDDNEGLILDGGIHGHAIGTAGDEPECG
ncbi:C2HC5 finger protein [Beauveria brongniartii RCEF 3172]|uniref:C2HC5 finger protein n=1 Tax=Beauveria brongniartii RCEF 3172 TaxID=1081107 RepID=A0A162K291_9HYPO|nr:C2HC5 finger protein [Beauveria brongniartii RCEF 3172]